MREKLKKILNSKVSIPSQLGKFWSSNPMLLMFLSFLMEKDQFHSRDKDSEARIQSQSLCEIYLKLVMFLCGQTICTLSYSVKSLGKVVLENLQSGSSAVFHERDFNLILDGRLLVRHLNNLVSFPHRTFDIFVGALYFILMLDCGQAVESLLGSDTKQIKSSFLTFNVCPYYTFLHILMLGVPHRLEKNASILWFNFIKSVSCTRFYTPLKLCLIKILKNVTVFCRVISSCFVHFKVNV